MTDLEISRQVRGILARHWIDLGHLVLRTVSGRVYIRGMLSTIHGPAAQLEPARWRRSPSPSNASPRCGA